MEAGEIHWGYIKVLEYVDESRVYVKNMETKREAIANAQDVRDGEVEFVNE